MILITGSVVVRPDALDEALRLAVEHVHRSRSEPGCLTHAVHQDLENPNKLVFVEEWKDLDAVRTHFGVPESGTFVEAISALATEPPTLDVMSAKRAIL
jgi:quinol monooxygenase YgiN